MIFAWNKLTVVFIWYLNTSRTIRRGTCIYHCKKCSHLANARYTVPAFVKFLWFWLCPYGIYSICILQSNDTDKEIINDMQLLFFKPIVCVFTCFDINSYLSSNIRPFIRSLWVNKYFLIAIYFFLPSFIDLQNCTFVWCIIFKTTWCNFKPIDWNINTTSIKETWH